MARSAYQRNPDPRGLAPRVKKVAQLACDAAAAIQPDSPSRQAGWGLVLVWFPISISTCFTIHARWMGSWLDRCVRFKQKRGGLVE